MDDGGSQQDSNTLHQVSHHVNEGRPHTGVAVMVSVLLAPSVPLQPAGWKAMTVAVGGSRLMEDQDHPEQGQTASEERLMDQKRIIVSRELVVLTGR